MQMVYCWNCLRSVEKVRSKTSGNLICVACGATISERVPVADLSVLETGFLAREDPLPEKASSQETSS